MAVRDFLPIFVLLAIVAAPAAAQSDQGDDEPPRILSADDQRPALRPGPDQFVAVLDLVIEASGDKVVGVEAKSVRRVNSFAPKVFARSGGHWKVTVQGEQAESFTVVNPLRDIEIENREGSKSPYSQVRLSGPVEWQLIVPLYKDGRPLDATSIQIVDMEQDRVLLEVDLDAR